MSEFEKTQRALEAVKDSLAKAAETLAVDADVSALILILDPWGNLAVGMAIKHEDIGGMGAALHEIGDDVVRLHAADMN